MTEYTTKELQVEILRLLKMFHQLCVDHDIKYTLHGGSLLGAVREKGFIPWDDDGDVALFREEYEKLAKLIPHDSTNSFYLECDRDKVKKVWLKQEGKPSVWLDIFIYDFISEKRVKQKLKIFGLTLLAAYSKDETSMAQFRTNQRAKGLKRIIYEGIYGISKNIPIEKRIERVDAFCRDRYIGAKKFVHRANDQLWAMPMILPVDKMLDYKCTQFEDTELMISNNYDEILTQLYGADYMTPRRAAASETEVHNISRNSN